MGLHTADAVPEHGDYHGVPVNRCARIMGVAHGGQVLVSDRKAQHLCSIDYRHEMALAGVRAVPST